jgi:hypothetical protein
MANTVATAITPGVLAAADVFVYPGSGATCDTQELKLAQEKAQEKAKLAQEKAAATAAAAAAAAAGGANGTAPAGAAGAGEQQVKQEQAAAGDTDTSHMVSAASACSNLQLLGQL